MSVRVILSLYIAVHILAAIAVMALPRFVRTYDVIELKKEVAALNRKTLVRDARVEEKEMFAKKYPDRKPASMHILVHELESNTTREQKPGDQLVDAETEAAFEKFKKRIPPQMLTNPPPPRDVSELSFLELIAYAIDENARLPDTDLKKNIWFDMFLKGLIASLPASLLILVGQLWIDNSRREMEDGPANPPHLKRNWRRAA